MRPYTTIRSFRNSNHSRHEAKRRQRKALTVADKREWLKRYWQDFFSQYPYDARIDADLYDDMSH